MFQAITLGSAEGTAGGWPPFARLARFSVSLNAKSMSPLLLREPEAEFWWEGPPPSGACRIWWLIRPLIWLLLLDVRAILGNATGAAPARRF